MFYKHRKSFSCLQTQELVISSIYWAFETRRNYTVRFGRCCVSVVTDIGAAQRSPLILHRVIYLAFVFVKNWFHSKLVAASLYTLWLKGFIYAARRQDCSKILLLGLQNQVLKNYTKMMLTVTFWHSQRVSVECWMPAECSGLLLGYRRTVRAKGAANTFQTIVFQAERECIFLPRTQFCFQGTRWEENGAENTNT